MQSRLARGALVATTWLFAPALIAQGDAAAEVESFAAVQKEFDEAMAKWNKDYRAAVEAKASRKEITELRSARPQPQQFAKRVETIVTAKPASDDGGAGAAWLISRARVRGEQFDRALAVLGEHHSGSAHVEQVLSSLTRSLSSAATKFLEKQYIACEGDRQALAVMAFGEHLKNVSGTVRRLAELEGEELERYVGYYGRDTVDFLKNANAKEYEARAEKHLDQVVNNEAMAAVSYRGATLGEHAGRALFEMRNLAIGKVAPDIVAEDIDGVPMKLSDYRGKVVVLDFWGDW